MKQDAHFKTQQKESQKISRAPSDTLKNKTQHNTKD